MVFSPHAFKPGCQQCGFRKPRLAGANYIFDYFWFKEHACVIVVTGGAWRHIDNLCREISGLTLHCTPICGVPTVDFEIVLFNAAGLSLLGLQILYCFASQREAMQETGKDPLVFLSCFNNLFNPLHNFLRGKIKTLPLAQD